MANAKKKNKKKKKKPLLNAESKKLSTVKKQSNKKVTKKTKNETKIGEKRTHKVPKPPKKRKEQRVFSTLSVIIIAILFSIIGAIVFGIVGRYIENKDIDETSKKEEITVVATGNVLGKSKTFNPMYITPPPPVIAKSYKVIRITKDGEHIKMHAKSPSLQLPPASLTKLMTALVAMENYPLSTNVTMPAKCTTIEGSKAGFKAGDTLKLEDMLYGLLVRSGADAACAIANIKGEGNFIKQMNEKAQELNLENTHFQNEIGFDAGNSQISTVNDITKITEEALKSGVFRKIVGTKNITLHSLTSNTQYHLYNTNDLLSKIPGTIGIKTGYTENAGGCLSYLYENTQTGEQILIILLGSTDHETRFQDTKKLLDWANAQIVLLEKHTQQPQQESTTSAMQR